MSTIKELKLNSFSDERGNLVAIESFNGIPFAIKRVYYIYELSSAHPRGFHAHKKLQQFAICIKGNCVIKLDDGCEKSVAFLDTPLKGIMIDKLVWHEMHDFSDDCILMVLASDYYDEDDYIRKYEDFLDLV